MSPETEKKILIVGCAVAIPTLARASFSCTTTKSWATADPHEKEVDSMLGALLGAALDAFIMHKVSG